MDPIATSIGPLQPETRDKLKEFRDRRDLPNYEAALQTLLNEATDID
jgi:hypothetical protein